MFKIKIYCNDGDIQYWEDGIGTYDTYDKALIACYGNALQETKSLMENADRDRWFEVEEAFEITEPYVNDKLKDVTFFEVATVYYDHAPQDRENDCDIQIVTGYMIVEENTTTNTIITRVNLVDCCDHDAIYGVLTVKNVSLEEVQKKIYEIKNDEKFLEENPDWCIDDVFEHFPEDWEWEFNDIADNVIEI